MIHADLQALAIFTAGALAVIQQMDREERQIQDHLEKEYSAWEERIARIIPFLY